MRRYTVRINETEHTIDVEELAADTFTVHLEDGRLIDVVLTDHQDLAQAVIAPEIEVGQVRAAAAPATVPTAGAGRAATAATASAPPRRLSAPRGAGGGSSVTAPMPGVILGIEVAAGATVVRGQTLMVLEAMKMKNELKAQRDGRVAAILVNTGDQVKHGDVLLEFEG